MNSLNRHVSKLLKPILKAAQADGFIIELTGKKHLKWKHPDKSKPFVITSGTPSDKRALERIKSDLRNITGWEHE